MAGAVGALAGAVQGVARVRAAVLPGAFGSLAGQLRYVRQVSPEEYSSECPRCGGEPHPNGEWPDRFRLFLDGSPRVWCRRCGYFAFVDQLEGGKPPDPAELERWRREQIRREEERKRSAELALKHLRDEERWRRYHEALSERARAWWLRRGISPSMQDWWELGWCEDFTLVHRGQAHRVQTATIPIFGYGWEPQNVKHRLIDPPEGVQKYRYELYGQPQPLFLCDPERKVEGRVIAVEGEIKAMVTFMALEGGKDLDAVVGLPGVTPGPAVQQALENAEQIVLVLDPGSEAQGRQACEKLGVKRTRLLVCPMKIDDAILANGWGAREVKALLRQARRVG